MNYPTELQRLITTLKKLPGIGSKSAERFAFSLLNWKEKDLLDTASLFATLKEKLKNCPECNCLMDESYCPFCDQRKRTTKSLCIISSPKDAYAIEETHSYQGLYHVIESLLSPLDGRTPESLNLPHLTDRIKKHSIHEVIIALDSTLEGDATSLFLKNHLDTLGIKVSRLAFGMPMGSTLDYIDEGTLSLAITGRQKF